MGAVVYERNLVAISYRIRWVAACVVRLILRCIWDPHFGGMGGCTRTTGVSDGTIRKNDGGFI